MNRKTVILLASIAATILGIVPVIITALIIYQHVSNDYINNFHNIVNIATKNSGLIFKKIDHSLQQLNHLDSKCDGNTLIKLQKIAFLNPDISEFFIASQQGRISCSSLSGASSNLTLNLINPQATLQLEGPLHLPLIDLPILVAYKKAPHDLIYGALMLPQIFTRALAHQTNHGGFIGIINLENNHIYVAQGGPIAIKETSPLPQGDLDLINIDATIPEDQTPIVMIKKVPQLTHSFIVAAAPYHWLWQEFWKNILIFGSIGLLFSTLLICMVIIITRRRLSLQGELSRAITKQEFVMHYQPVIDIENNQCIGAEALIRWQHPEDGLIMPDLFIPLAEKNGQIIPMTLWAIQHAAREFQPLLQKNPHFHLALNIGAKLLATHDILDLIKKICAESHLSPTQFIFELTERELIEENNDVAKELMHNLRNLGVSLALDDFGTGYSSLSYVRSFPLDYLKIDRQFIAAISTGAITVNLIDSIIDIAQKLQMTIIAEGIENTEQLQYIKVRGVKLVQGWYYSKALAKADFITFLRTHHHHLHID